MRIFGLIGMPLGHSFSHKYFKGKFEKEGITNSDYRLFPLETINELSQILTNFQGLAGLNVTIPYKQSVIPFLDKIDPDAKEIGAVNTIHFERMGSKPILTGYNTDYLGFIDSMKPYLKDCGNKALILGTGGSSLAVAHALKKLGIEFKKVSRNPVREEIISYASLNEDIIYDYKIIINTTPVGMYPNISEKPAIPYEAVTKNHLLFDLIYNPDKTTFLKLGETHGASAVNGFQMLIQQAEYAWKIWNKH